MIKTVRLGNVLDVQNGYAFDSKYFAEEGMPLIRIRDLKDGKSTQIQYNGDYKDDFVVRRGDLLIGMDGEFSCHEWKGEDALLNQRVCRLVGFTSSIHPKYVHYVINKELKKIEDKTSYVTVKHLSASAIRDIKIPFPPLKDQIKIATLLKKVEDLIQKRKESIDLLDELVKSTFLEMFGDPYNNQKKYRKIPISELVIEVNYGTSAKSSDNGLFPYLRMNNITYEGNWDFESLKYVDVSGSDKIKYLLRPGDLVFNRTNSKELVGKTAVCDFEDEMIIAGYLIRVRLKKNCNPWFLWGYLNSKHGKRTLFNMAKSIVGMANINAQEFQRIETLLPPINDQKKFEEIVKRINDSRSDLRKSLDELQHLYNSLSQRAFKGELDLSKINVDHLLPKTGPRVMAKADPFKEYKTLSDAEAEEIMEKAKEKDLSSRMTSERSEFLPEKIVEQAEEVLDELGAKKSFKKLIIDGLNKHLGYAQLANWIRKEYKGYHFTSEMLLRFCIEEKKVRQDYYTSKELKENRKLDETQGLQWRLFDALTQAKDENDTKFLELEQVFYNGENPAFELKIRKEDYPLIKDKSARERSGVYLKLKA